MNSTTQSMASAEQPVLAEAMTEVPSDSNGSGATKAAERTKSSDSSGKAKQQAKTVDKNQAIAERVTAESGAPLDDEVVQRIGHVIKMLRESMRELGLDKEIEKAAKAIPDARDRLSYIGNMTEQAAERTLNAVARAQPLQEEISKGAEGLDKRWAEWFENPVELNEARTLVEETRTYLKAVPEKANTTNKELLDIMMAQDFQDLTGQVIKRMMDVIHSLEFQLLQVVLDSVPNDDDREELQKRANELKEAEQQRGSAFLNGPQIDPAAADVVNSQDQVDDLLADLGF